MTKNQSTTNPEENQIVTKDHFSTIKEQIKKIVSDAETIVFDYTTSKGRKEAEKYAFGLTKSRVVVDKTHKAAKKDTLAYGRELDATKNELSGILVGLREKILAPVKEFELKEKAAKELEEYCNCFYEATLENTRLDEERRMIELEKYELDHAEAHHMHDLFKREAIVKAAEEKAVAEEEERERLAEVERVKKEAADQATLEAENKAKAEKEAVEQEKQDAIAAKEKAEKDAEDAKIRAESDRVNAENRRLADIETARIKAEREKQDAILAEQKKQADKEAAAKKESDRLAKIEDDRRADVNYRTMINNKILNSLKKIGLSDDDALTTAKALINGQIIAVSVNY